MATENGNRELLGFRLVGDTWESFKARHDIEFSGENECVICKKTFTTPTDFWVQKDMCIISWKHDNCRNGGPGKAALSGELGERMASRVGAIVEDIENDN